MLHVPSFQPNRLVYILGALSFILLTACDSAPVNPSSPSSPPPATDNRMKPQAVPNTAIPALPGTSWAWQSTRMGNSNTVATAPDRYTIAFQEENRLAVRADCNRGGSVYHLQGQSLRFDPIAMTKMLCPQGSQDTHFLDALRTVDAYRLENAQTLVLQLSQGGQMTLVRQP